MKTNLLKITLLLPIIAWSFSSCQDQGKEEDNLTEFTVFFNCSEDCEIHSQIVKKGEKVIEPEAPTRSGYSFVAWFKDTELSNEWDFDTDVIDSGLTLYAKWFEWTDYEDPIYPMSIDRLPEETLLQRHNDFAQRNPDIFSTLNQFGFCNMGDIYHRNFSSGGFTEEEAIAAVKEFVTRNPEYTGVNNSDDLQIRSALSSTGFNDVVSWVIRSGNQAINDIEVDNTEILFITRHRTLVEVHGNHFPDVYVPGKFNFDAERAKFQLLGKEIIHSGHVGPFSAGIVTEESLKQSTAKLIIIPVKTDEKIELHVVWQIYLERPLHYIFEIDVMTGEIIRERQTIYS